MTDRQTDRQTDTSIYKLRLLQAAAKLKKSSGM